MSKTNILVLLKLNVKYQKDQSKDLLFLSYVNDMKQTVNCDLFLYVDDSCLVYQHNNVSNIEQNLNKNFSNICDRFVDNNLSIRFGENRTKCILFGTKQKLNKIDWH